MRFEELIHRLDADVDVDAVGRLPPPCRSWLQELLRGSRVTGGQVLRLLTHPDTDPRSDIAPLITDSPPWLLQASPAAWIVLGEFLVSHRIFKEGGKAFETVATQGVPDSDRWRIRAASEERSPGALPAQRLEDGSPGTGVVAVVEGERDLAAGSL